MSLRSRSWFYHTSRCCQYNVSIIWIEEICLKYKKNVRIIGPRYQSWGRNPFYITLKTHLLTLSPNITIHWFSKTFDSSSIGSFILPITIFESSPISSKISWASSARQFFVFNTFICIVIPLSMVFSSKSKVARERFLAKFYKNFTKVKLKDRDFLRSFSFSLERYSCVR